MSVDPARGLRAAEEARATEQPAFITVLTDEQVTAFAGLADDGPLAGIPFAVKDNIDVRGVASTAACPTLTAPAERSSYVVERLLGAGAIPVAKTNMDQFATGLVGTRSPFGACHSIYSTDHISGGSSSGSAVAVALGVVPLALGTDTAGSGRVPAAFNGLVGMKPTRGLVSTRGLLPACPSLDCITTLTRTVADAEAALRVMIGFDPLDPYSRPLPPAPPPGVASRMRVIAVPSAPLDLEPAHEAAWQQAIQHAEAIARVVEVDVEPFLKAARLLYEAPFVSERTAAFGELLEPDGPHLDPTVASIVRRGADYSAPEAFVAFHELMRLQRLTSAVFVSADALLLPVTPWHPTLAAVASDPVGANSRNGVFTNMTNLLDMCAIAVPAGMRADGLPFGVQLLAPAFADVPLMRLAAAWVGEGAGASWSVPEGRSLVAVAGAHLSGQPANPELLRLGGHLHARARTAGGYRMYSVAGPFPRPGLVRSGEGPADGIEIEVWDLPTTSLVALAASIAPPLSLGLIDLDDDTTVTGFVAEPSAANGATDITHFGGWRRYVASQV